MCAVKSLFSVYVLYEIPVCLLECVVIYFIKSQGFLFVCFLFLTYSLSDQILNSLWKCLFLLFVLSFFLFPAPGLTTV